MDQEIPAGLVSDPVWERLAGEAVLVDEREARVLRRSAVGVAGLLATAVGIWALGILSPRLEHGSASGGTADEVTHAAEYEFDMVNRGLVPVSVVGVSIDLPGLVVTSTSPTSLEVPGSSSRHVRLGLQVQDCTVAIPAAEGSTSTPLSVLVARPWGTVTTEVLPPAGLGSLADLVLLACARDPF